jgi:hypothetical protein
LTPGVPYPEAQREQILAAYYARPSLRGSERVFGVARQTRAVWVKKSGAGSSPQGYAAARASAR